ncbi:YbdD/YjiX family protein [Mycobacterium sp. IS-1742]|uniref:YbdD/YjiX family protein n=1 Tax=Mycobacterium sp. IS-1742 TaxID=1772285 RepID=UPI0009E73913|nr:YbdD/YjiX family protein [Mycobacterium sp. IS-1742]
MGRAVGIARKIRWYIASLMGDNHYRRYLEHRRRTHPGEPVLTEREYWHLRHAAAEAEPGARCC